MNKLIIIDGIDRSGKTLAIEKIKEEYKDKYEIITIHPEGFEHFNKFFGTITKELLFDTILSSNIYSTFQSIYSHLQRESKKPYLFLIGRFYISNIVNGSILRNNNFTSIWGGNYEIYVEAFENQLKELDIEQYYFVVTKKWHTEFKDDNDNEFIEVKAEQLFDLNRLYKLSTLKPSLNLLNIELETDDYLETYNKIIEIGKL